MAWLLQASNCVAYLPAGLLQDLCTLGCQCCSSKTCLFNLAAIPRRQSRPDSLLCGVGKVWQRRDVYAVLQSAEHRS